MSPFNIPWGTTVRVRRAPKGVMLMGFQGTLVDPNAFMLASAADPSVVALLKVDSIHWSVRADGWEFEAVDRPAETNGEWLGFVARCRARIETIVQSNDDGMFAKFYAKDVARLLDMLQGIERSNEGAEMVSDAWEDTK